ncbi:MAG: AgmX/PglI C-terminal domain-containing protein, partial [Myxococcaceae bacterium]
RFCEEPQPVYWPVEVYLMASLAADGGVERNVFSSLGGAPARELLVPDGGIGLGRGASPAQPPGAGPVTVTGALDKALIQRVIRAHLGLITKCATDHPATEERTVLVQFGIDGSGAVSSSKPTQPTVANEPLARCVAGVIERMMFPKPNGGGVVTVNYPFRFTAR